MYRRAPFTDRDTFTVWLATLSPGDQVHVCRTLAALGRVALSRHADRVVYEHTRTMTHAATAAALGLTDRQVLRAVTTHIGHQPELTGRAGPPRHDLADNEVCA